MSRVSLKASACCVCLAALTGCLYTGDVPPVLAYEDPAAPRIVNELPPRYSRVPIGPAGQLFEVWPTDENTYDQDQLTISWTLEGLTGLRGEGSKLLLREADLPAAGGGDLYLEVQIRDSTGLESTDQIYWRLTPQPYLER